MKTSTDTTPVGKTGPRSQLVAAQTQAKEAWQQVWLRLTSIDPDGFVRLVMIIGALLLVGWVIKTFWAELLPFQVGIVLAYLMLPVVNRLEQWMPRSIAVVLVLISFLTLLGLAIAFVVPPLIRQLNNLLLLLPNTEQVEKWLTALNNYIATLPQETQVFIDQGLQNALETLRGNILAYVRGTINFIIRTVFNIVGTVTFLIGFVVIPFWLFFVLNDQKQAVISLDKLLPEGFRTDFWAILRVANRIIGSYFRGQLILAGIIFGAVFIGLNFLRLIGVEGIQFVLLLAVFAGFMEFIPIIGPILSAVPAIIVGMFHSWESAFAILILFIIIQQVEGNLLVPRIVGDSVNIHPALVMILVIILAPLGIAWLIVAVPLVAVFRDIYRYIYGRFSTPRRPAGLLPDEPFPDEPFPMENGPPDEAVT
ncbi:MAG: AI-2E family transporter [Anaerolineae bacterium]|nr:AI-2E family transporter [Anaerolineae bacterium]